MEEIQPVLEEQISMIRRAINNEEIKINEIQSMLKKGISNCEDLMEESVTAIDQYNLKLSDEKNKPGDEKEKVKNPLKTTTKKTIKKNPEKGEFTLYLILCD